MGLFIKTLFSLGIKCSVGLVNIYNYQRKLITKPLQEQLLDVDYDGGCGNAEQSQETNPWVQDCGVDRQNK